MVGAGAIVGDVVGSRFEFDNHRSKEFELFTDKCFATDDSIMTVAVMKALLETPPDDYAKLLMNTIECMQEIGRQYPNRGYGGRFAEWIFSDSPKPYNSFGNGAAMRISPVAWVARNYGELLALSDIVTVVTHNHPEGMKGAKVTATCIWLARQGETKRKIADYARSNYDLSFSLDAIRGSYKFNETCQGTVPQAIVAFLESNSFEDAIRNAISIGGDSDTLAAITGSIAEAYYGVPDDIRSEALSFLPTELRYIVSDFEIMYFKRMYADV